VLWDKAALDKAQSALEAAQAKLADREADFERLQADLAARQTALTEMESQRAERTATERKLAEIIEARETALARAQNMLMAQESELRQLQSALAEREAAVSQLQQEVTTLGASAQQVAGERDESKLQFTQLQEEMMLKNSELRNRLRETKLQLEAQEAEAENYFQQMEQQGARLAEIQATLIERELQAKQLQETTDKQKVVISRMKEVTSEKINKLNTDLAQTRQQLKQALAIVNKLRSE
jgi:chromosome segregation ATPase